MKRAHTKEQIIEVLQETQAGAAVAEVRRRHGISQRTFYRWKQRFGGLQVSDAKRVRLLEEENG